MRKCWLLCCLLAFCELQAQDVTEMRTVQVAAHRRLSDTGVQKTTLDTAVLHQNVALSMADVLTRHSSLFIKSYGRATESTAEFRGTSPSHTQVLWNGLKINSPMLGTVDFSTIPAYFVDEATLLHGASSLTLTGGGLGGAVDLKTLPWTENGPGLQYVQGFGSFDTYDQFLRLTYGTDRFSSSTRLVYSTSENRFPYTNYDKKVDERDADGNLLRSYHPTERNRSGYFRDLHALQDFHLRGVAGGNLAANVWYTRSRRGLPFLSVDYRDDTQFKNEQVLQTIRNVLSWQRPLATQGHLTARAGYTYQDIAYDYSSTRQAVTSSGSPQPSAHSGTTDPATPHSGTTDPATPHNGTTDPATSHSGTTDPATPHNSAQQLQTLTTVITASRSYSQQAFLQGRADFMPANNWLLTADAALTYNHVRSHDRTPFHIGDNYNRGRVETTLSLAAKYRPTPRLSLSAVLREEVYHRDAVPPIPALFAEYAILKPKAAPPAPNQPKATSSPSAHQPKATSSPPSPNQPKATSSPSAHQSKATFSPAPNQPKAASSPSPNQPKASPPAPNQPKAASPPFPIQPSPAVSVSGGSAAGPSSPPIPRQPKASSPPLASLIIKASLARNYRYPTMDDLYFQPGGNPDLRPERGITYDGGLEGSLVCPRGSLKANLSAFNSYITDWILWTPNAKGFWQPANLKRVHNYGVETTLTAEMQLHADWHLTLMGNYAYTPSINQSRDLDEADTSYGKQLVYVPRHSANLTASARWRHWHLTYQWHSYSERFTTTSNEVSRITGRLLPYYMSHLTLERQLRLGGKSASIKGVIYNLLDSEYVTVLSRPMAGRHYELFLEIKL